MLESNKVSIIIPIYNAEQYLKKCIDSVLMQTYENIEIILINDGSNDHSEQICNTYLQKYKNIQYFYQQNKGVSIARNNGIRNASGDFIYFLDADDTIDNDFVKSSVEVANKNNSDIVIVALNAIQHKEIVNSDYTWLSTWAMFLRKSFLDKYKDIYFPEDIKIGEDAIFSHKLLLLTKHVNINKNAKYYYRIHSQQTIEDALTRSEYYYENITKWFTNLEKFYSEYKLLDSCEYQISLFVAFSCAPYWNLKLNKLKKREYHQMIRTFVQKHKLKHFKTYNFTFSNFMARLFIQCNTWRNFEIYLILIKTFKLIKNLLAKSYIMHKK